MAETISLFSPAPLDMADSYGLVAAMLAKELTALGNYVNLAALGGAWHRNQTDEVDKIVRQPYRKSHGGIFLGYPRNYAKHGVKDGPRIAITMFESSRIPDDWPPVLNTMDAVIVPSRFCAQSFRASGVSVPIHVVPLGIGESYRFVERAADRPLTFLAFMDRGARKGGLVAMQAFLMAFGDDMGYRFVWKGRNPKQRVNFTNPNFEVVQQDMSEEELAALYQRADVLINPNKGEGFGLIPREFAATGGIALATGWGGTADHIDEWGWPLPYTLEKADWTGNQTLEGRELGEWATCDPGAVAKILRDVAVNRECYLEQARQKAKVAARYTWRRFALDVRYIWRGVVEYGYA